MTRDICRGLKGKGGESLTRCDLHQSWSLLPTLQGEWEKVRGHFNGKIPIHMKEPQKQIVCLFLERP